VHYPVTSQNYTLTLDVAKLSSICKVNKPMLSSDRNVAVTVTALGHIQQ